MILSKFPLSFLILFFIHSILLTCSIHFDKFICLFIYDCSYICKEPIEEHFKYTAFLLMTNWAGIIKITVTILQERHGKA